MDVPSIPWPAIIVSSLIVSLSNCRWRKPIKCNRLVALSTTSKWFSRPPTTITRTHYYRVCYVKHKMELHDSQHKTWRMQGIYYVIGFEKRVTCQLEQKSCTLAMWLSLMRAKMNFEVVKTDILRSSYVVWSLQNVLDSHRNHKQLIIIAHWSVIIEADTWCAFNSWWLVS